MRGVLRAKYWSDARKTDRNPALYIVSGGWIDNLFIGNSRFSLDFLKLYAIIEIDEFYGGVSMDDFLEQVARRRRQGAYTVIYFLTWVMIVIGGFSAIMYLTNIIQATETGIHFNFISLILALIFGGVTYLLWRRADYCRMEYDYSFTNGTLDISQVLNNKRRRYLTALEMKDVIRCGPAQGPAFMKVLNEKDLKKHNWFLNRDAKLYYFYFVKKNVKHLAVVELTDEMVELIRSKSYLQRGVWTDADGKTSYGVS